MSNFLLSFLVGIASAAWIYSKMMRTTGGITRSSLIVAAISGLLIFLVLLILSSVLL